MLQKEGKGEGWLFTLSAPSYFPFMQHCPSSTLRQEMYLAKMAVGAAGDAYDNRELIRRLANLRLELAQLLGSKSFAEKVLEELVEQPIDCRRATCHTAGEDFLSKALGA